MVSIGTLLRQALQKLRSRKSNASSGPAGAESIPPPPKEGAPLQTPLATLKAWSQYAKDRFDSEAARIVEFRNWGRQLAAAIAVVIAFEVNAIVQLVVNGDRVSWVIRLAALALLGFSLWRQRAALTMALGVGYRGASLTGPESPVVLGGFILGQDEWEISRIIGAYYAKSYAEFYNLAENLSGQIASASKEFRRSFVPLLVGLAILQGHGKVPPPSADDWRQVRGRKGETRGESRLEDTS